MSSGPKLKLTLPRIVAFVPLLLVLWFSISIVILTDMAQNRFMRWMGAVYFLVNGATLTVLCLVWRVEKIIVAQTRPSPHLRRRGDRLTPYAVKLAHDRFAGIDIFHTADVFLAWCISWGAELAFFDAVIGRVETFLVRHRR